MSGGAVETVRDAELIGARVPFEELPVIDIGALSSGSSDAKDEAAAALGAAARDIGFCYVSNHGVPHAVIDAFFDRMVQFFELPEEEKMKTRIDAGGERMGYVPVGQQRTNDDDDDAEGDLAEGYEIGLELSPDDPDASYPFYGPTPWPGQPPGFREAMLDYLDAMIALSRRTLGGLALSLGLEEDLFAPYLKKPIVLLSPRHYPPQSGHITRKRLGVGAHCDYGCLTFIVQDDVGGLQVRNSKGRWIEAKPVPGTFVCNTGQLLERWTNGAFIANTHRVINDSGRARYSAPFFFTPDRDAEIEVLAVCCGPGNPPRYPSVNSGEHYVERMRYMY